MGEGGGGGYRPWPSPAISRARAGRRVVAGDGVGRAKRGDVCVRCMCERVRVCVCVCGGRVTCSQDTRHTARAGSVLVCCLCTRQFCSLDALSFTRRAPLPPRPPLPLWTTLTPPPPQPPPTHLIPTSPPSAAAGRRLCRGATHRLARRKRGGADAVQPAVASAAPGTDPRHRGEGDVTERGKVK
jgi:hypothetical protein